MSPAMSLHSQTLSASGGIPHGRMIVHPVVNGHMAAAQAAARTSPPTITIGQKIAQLNEAVWMQIGSLSELMGDLEGAMGAYDHALRHNQWSIPAMTAISSILRIREQFHKAIEYLQSILKIDAQNGDAWGNLGHCHLMIDNLQEAYTAYQQALYHLQNPKEPKLWYGIGILYDRYGSLDHAEEAFSQVMQMEPTFEKANEIYFRLGIIYKQQHKFPESLACFKYIVADPPRPLTEEDIWFQIGHVHEQQKDFMSAKSAYRKVLDRDPNHAKVLQQLGWLFHQESGSYSSQEQAIEYLEKSVAADTNDAQSWYLLGRCYMAQTKYPKAYEAYQQAVYRDGCNPTFWCSIGVLYYQINQYRDALDAYSRAIRLNPYISEVWYDLGTLYESCNNQTNDALDAYSRAAELDPNNFHIKTRLQLLQSGQSTSSQSNVPVPQDIHPQAYQAPGVGVPPGPQWGPPPPTNGAGPPPTVAAPQDRISDWARTVNEMQSAGPPPPAPEHVHPYADPRDRLLPQQSPRQDPRAYDRVVIPQRTKALSPSPKFSAVAAGPPPPVTYAATTQPPISFAAAPPIERAPPTTNGYATPIRHPLGPHGPPPPGPPPAVTTAAIPMYGRPYTPPSEMRPIMRDERPMSPPPYVQPYHHPAANGALAAAPGPVLTAPPPPPPPPPPAAPVDMRDREERPSSATTKRTREWEDQGPVKKLANDEARARLEDVSVVRHVSPPRGASPPTTRDRHWPIIDEHPPPYHPSEAAHRPPMLPSIQHMHQQQQTNAASAAAPHHGAGPTLASLADSAHAPTSPRQAGGSSGAVPLASLSSAMVVSPTHAHPKDDRMERVERKELVASAANGTGPAGPLEPPARKMEVDEDYDDYDDDKKGVVGAAVGSKTGSPRTEAPRE